MGREGHQNNVQKNDKHVKKNQRDFRQDSRTYLYCFANELGKRDFTFSGMSYKIFDHDTLKKLAQRRFHFG